MNVVVKAKGAGKTDLVTSAIWNTICGKEKFFAEKALEIGRKNNNPRFKFLARVITTIAGENPGAVIKGLYDENRATKTEIVMEAKEASGMSHSKEEAWINAFWVRIGTYKASVEGLDNPVLKERFMLLSAVVGAYSDGSLCFDSKKVFEDYNAKVKQMVPAARASKKKKGKKMLDPIPAGANV